MPRSEMRCRSKQPNSSIRKYVPGVIEGRPDLLL